MSEAGQAAADVDPEPNKALGNVHSRLSTIANRTAVMARQLSELQNRILGTNNEAPKSDRYRIAPINRTDEDEKKEPMEVVRSIMDLINCEVGDINYDLELIASNIEALETLA